MIRSMTGYGEASAHIDGTHFFVQIRSLNGRHFKASVRLQEEFESLEAELESRLRKNISRGSVTLKASCTDDTEQAAGEINCKALDKYVEQLSQSKHVASGRVTIELGSLLDLPGVVQPPADEGERIGRVREVFAKLTDQACAGLVKLRISEGQMLAEDLTKQLSLIQHHLAEVKERAPDVVKDFETRLMARIDELLAGSRGCLTRGADGYRRGNHPSWGSPGTIREVDRTGWGRPGWQDAGFHGAGTAA